MPFQLNKEIVAALAAIMGDNPLPPPLPVGDIEGRRTMTDGFFELINSQIPDFPEVTTSDHTAKASDGAEISLRWYQKTGSPAGPALLYAHGGGMIALNINQYDKLIKRYVSLSGVPFLAVDYRLAPENPAPGPVKDCYAGLQWLHAHAEELGVDPSRIAIGGDSGGGGIAAGLAHYAKLQGGPGICKQMLIYPMIDDRTVEADPQTAPLASWSHMDNETAWSALLGSKRGGADVSPCDAAARMTVADAEGLPPTYIDVGEIDIFRDEDLEYARKLTKAGVSCTLILVPDMTHGMEMVLPEAEVAKPMYTGRVAFLKSL